MDDGGGMDADDETGAGGRLARLRARGAALADFFLGAALALALAALPALAGGTDGAGGFFDERARAAAGGVLARGLAFVVLEAAGGRVDRFVRLLAPSLEDASDDLAEAPATPDESGADLSSIAGSFASPTLPAEKRSLS